MYIKSFVTFLITCMFGLFLFETDAHVDAGSGNPLQLFSYRIPSGSPTPTIDGDLLTGGAGEWKDAYCRELNLVDSSSNATVANIFLMNDDDSLYIAMLKSDNNNGNYTGIFLYFDQGSTNGQHDDVLTAATSMNEPGYGIWKASENNFPLFDLYWDGTDWSEDGDGADDFNGSMSTTGNAIKVQTFELAIPLDNGKSFDANNADLKVTSLTQELGMYIRVTYGGGETPRWWDATNADSSNAATSPGWADLQLNVQRDFNNFYSSYAVNGIPTIDGTLDDPWRGSYRRDIILSNFDGEFRNAVFYSLQDHTNGNLYIALEISDATASTTDSLTIYFEEKAGDLTSARDFRMEDGAEDALSIRHGGSNSDLYWNDASSWTADGEAGDDHSAAVSYDATGNKFLFETRIPYDDLVDGQDIGVQADGVIGMLFRFRDAEATGKNDFFWEYTVNADTVRVDLLSSPKVYISSGWTNLQLGAPYVQVIHPEDNADVEGVINVRIYAVDENVNGIDSASFYRKSVPGTKYTLTRIADTDEWSGTWNVASLPNGADTLVIEVGDDDGIVVERLVNVNISNGTGTSAPPTVSITAPTSADTSTLSGVDTIRFTVDYAAGTSRDTTEISFNGDIWIPTSGSLSHTWVTTDFRDGTHSVQVRAVASNGDTGLSQIRTYEVSNSLTAEIIAPSNGEALAGAYTVRFRVDAVSPASIIGREVSIDGGAWSDTLVDDSTFTMHTGEWENGTHTIQLRGTDDKGRTGYSRQRAFIVDNEAPMAADPKAVYSGTAISTKSGTPVLVTVLVKDNLVGLRRDSAVVLTSASIDASSSSTYVMRDDGQEGDEVKGDNVFSALVTVNTDSTGRIGYSVTTADRLGNDTTLSSAIMLDNTAPTVNFALEPVPESGGDIRSGRTYLRKLVMKGTYGDIGGSGLVRVFISVLNDSGEHVNSSPVVLAAEDSAFSRVIELVPGANTIILHAADKAGNADSITGTVVYHEPKSTKVVDRDGATVNNPNGAAVTIGKNALPGATEITIVPVEPIEQRKPLDNTITLLNVAHDFGPDGTVFRKPVKVTLPYTAADLDTDQDGIPDIDQSELTIVFWDGNTWSRVGKATIDSADMLVSVNTNHFTIYDIAIDKSGPVTELMAYWSANPVKHTDGARFVYMLPDAGKVSLEIFDMAGDLVYRFSGMDGRAGAHEGEQVWRGTNVSGRFAGVGLYVYVFKYTNASTKKTKLIRKPIGVLK